MSLRTEPSGSTLWESPSLSTREAVRCVPARGVSASLGFPEPPSPLCGCLPGAITVVVGGGVVLYGSPPSQNRYPTCSSV